MKIVACKYHKHINRINSESQYLNNAISQFDKNHQRVISNSSILKQENKLFSRSFNFYIKEINKKEQYTQKIFKNLLMEYIDKGYEVPNLNVNPKLFSNHPLTTHKSEEIRAYYNSKKKPISFDKSNNYITKLLNTTRRFKCHQSPMRRQKQLVSIKNVAFIQGLKHLIIKNFEKENDEITEYNAKIAKIVSNEEENSNRYSTHDGYSINLSLINQDKLFLKAKRYVSSNDFSSHIQSYKELMKPIAQLSKNRVDHLRLTNKTNCVENTTFNNNINTNSNTNTNNTNIIHETNTPNIEMKNTNKRLTETNIRLNSNPNDNDTPKESSSCFQLQRRSFQIKSYTNSINRSNFISKLANSKKKNKISRNEKSEKLEQLFKQTNSSDFNHDYQSFVKEYKEYLLNCKLMPQCEIDNLIPKDFSFAKEFFHFSKTMKTKLQDAALVERFKSIFDLQNPLHKSYLKQIKRQDKKINAFNVNYINSLYGRNIYIKKIHLRRKNKQ